MASYPLWLAVVLPAMGWATLAPARDIHVPADQPTIQQGIDAAGGGDRVLVAPGEYVEHIDFQGKHIQVIGTGGAMVTTIAGAHAGAVVTFQGGESHRAVLSGFAIVRGMFGIQILGASPTIEDNDIRDNDGCRGAAIHVYQGNPRLLHNRIRRNNCNCEYGSIVLLENSSETVESNFVVGNTGSETSAAIDSQGARKLALARNVVTDNAGTGVRLEFSQRAAVYDNVVARNGGFGFDVLEAFGSAEVAALVNNTIADNRNVDLHVEAGWGGIVQAANNVVRTSAAPASVWCSGPVFLRHSLVHADNGALMEGDCDIVDWVLTEDPQFAGGAGPHAYWLAAQSPAIDGGDDSAVERIRSDASGAARIQGSHVDLGAYEYREP
jgi:hypothetical protein